MSYSNDHSDDLEKRHSLTSDTNTPIHQHDPIAQPSWIKSTSQKLAHYGIETHGVSPVPEEQQTYDSYFNLISLWLSANTGVITFSTGTLGPVYFGLGFRDSALVILFINLFGALIPSYFSTFGPITGMRQMIFARYAFGHIGASIISAANIVLFTGYLILNVILGGQSLAAGSSGDLSWDVGIVIISVLSLLLTFFGFKVLTVYERYAWIPVSIIFVIVTGIAGSKLENPAPLAPASAVTVLSFASSVAGFVISWGTLAADYTIYYRPTVSKTKIFLSAYVGFVLPLVLLELLGAAFASTMAVNEDFANGYLTGGVPGLIAASLEGVGRFGKFCMVVLAFSVTAACAPTMYSFGLSFQCIAPFFSIIPRYVFSIASTAVLIPVAIVASTHFEAALVDFVGVVGYYTAPYAAILIIEHAVFRRGRGDMYDRTAWSSLSRLPTGWPAIVSFTLCWGLIVPSMYQVWFVGPIGEKAGDIGFEVGYAVATVSYPILRWIDIKFVGKRLGGTEETL